MITNSQFTKRFRDGFFNWLNNSSFLDERFNIICGKINECFLGDNFHFNNASELAEIVPYLEDTLGNCNELNFENREMSLAYIFWHFLDRYIRFREIYLDLLKKGILPLLNSRINTLDVATGPAPIDLCFV